MKVGSLFSGIGGLDLGLERVGMEVIWQVESDEYCNKVLAKHWPDVRRYGDVKEIKPGELETVDLICGGFPCQPVSQAGKRKGTEDERWLWPEFHRIVCGVRPRWVLVENVPGLLSANSGGAMAEVLGDLAESGYNAEWDCIPASAVGANHQRDRLFIIANMANPIGIRHIHRQNEINSTDRGKQTFSKPTISSWWDTEPDVGRVVDGLSSRLDRVNRLKALGNAVVPQVAEYLGHLILSQENRDNV